jgi:cobalt-zinc-cadmium efflux system outer membrane protein
MAIASTKSASSAVVPAAAAAPAGDAAPGIVRTADLPTAGLAPGSPLTIADLEQLALANNPTLVQAAAYIDAARGKALQAGLPFNPTAGIVGENIGADRTAGEWTFFSLQQQIVTGGKLRLSRQKYEVEAELAEIQAHAQQLKVVNGLTAAYFDVLAGQRSLENERRLAGNAEEAVKTTEQLLNLGQANQQDLLQAQVEASQARVAVRNAETRLRQDWVHLATQIGIPDLPQRPLAGQLESDGPALNRDESLARLLKESPELAFAVTKVRQDQTQLERERREPIPNVTVRGGVGYNYETRNPTAQVGLSLPIPVFDRNQGTIRQAAADLTRSQAEVTRVQLDLQRRFADAFTRYQMAREQVENFRDQVMPKARKSVELYEEQLKARRASFPQVLVARRTVYQLDEEYNKSLVQFRRAEVEVRGLLLVDGLTAPSNPTPPGHINATPRPR